MFANSVFIPRKSSPRHRMKTVLSMKAAIPSNVWKNADEAMFLAELSTLLSWFSLILGMRLHIIRESIISRQPLFCIVPSQMI